MPALLAARIRRPAQVDELKSAVGGALSRFAAGEIDADQLIAFLRGMGVELRARCAFEGWRALEGWRIAGWGAGGACQ